MTQASHFGRAEFPEGYIDFNSEENSEQDILNVGSQLFKMVHPILEFHLY